MADVDYLVIKIDKNDGGNEAPKYLSDIVAGNLQLTETTGSITKKYPLLSIDEVGMDEMANLFHTAKKNLELNPEYNQSRVYVDAITIVE